MATFEIPLSPRPQSFNLRFPNGINYFLRLIYLFTPNDCWELDINDSNQNALVCGIPIITGTDLLAQYAYLGFGCKMFCDTDTDSFKPPRFWNLGISAHLYLQV